MKKLLAILLVTTLVFSLTTGCAKKEAPAASTNETNQAANDKKTVIKLGHVEAEDRSTHKAALEFEKYVEQQSNGKVDIEIYANGQLGGDRQMTEAVALGTIQMTLPATSVLTTYSPKFGVLDMPFIFKDEQAAFKAMDGEVGAMFNEILKSVGLYNLGYSYNGSRHMSNSKRPINEPKDLKGLKMRVMESPVYIDLFKYLGANATPMSFGEVFTALQQGTVDGQENAASLVYAMKFHEAQKYYSLTGHTLSFLPVLINDKFFKELPEDIQKIVADGAKKYLVEYQRNLEINDTDKYLNLLKEAGLQINEITPENHQKFVEAVKPMYDKYKAEIGQEVFDLVQKYNQ